MIEQFKKQYKFFYKKVFKQNFTFTSKNEKSLNTFLLSLDNIESFSEDWIFQYLCYQFEKYSKAETKMKLQFNWIVGKTALKKYKNRDKEHFNYFCSIFRKNYNIKKSHVVKNNNIENITLQYKSKERNRFEDRYRQFLHCKELNLYDYKSKECRFCKFKNICK